MRRKKMKPTKFPELERDNCSYIYKCINSKMNFSVCIYSYSTHGLEFITLTLTLTLNPFNFPIRCRQHLHQECSVMFLPDWIHCNEIKVWINWIEYALADTMNKLNKAVSNLRSAHRAHFSQSTPLSIHNTSPVQWRFIAEHFRGNGGRSFKHPDKRLFGLQMPLNLFGRHMTVGNCVCIDCVRYDGRCRWYGAIRFLLRLFPSFWRIGIFILCSICCTVLSPVIPDFLKKMFTSDGIWFSKR